MTTVQTTFAELNGVDACSHFAQVLIGTLMDVSDHLKVVVQHLVEVGAFLSRLCQDHR